jgi:hypothetical protein
MRVTVVKSTTTAADNRILFMGDLFVTLCLPIAASLLV